MHMAFIEALNKLLTENLFKGQDAQVSFFVVEIFTTQESVTKLNLQMVVLHNKER